MRGTTHTVEPAELLLEHVQALALDATQRPRPLERLSDEIGPRLAELLVRALARGQGIRRRDLVA